MKIQLGKLFHLQLSKIIKSIGMQLTIKKTLYSKNYKILPTTVTRDLINWRDMPNSWVVRLSMMKIILPRCFYRFHAIPTTLLGCFLRGMREMNKWIIIDI